MNKLDLVKVGTELIVTYGVSSLVGNAIKLSTDPKTKVFKKIAIGIGGFVVAQMVGDLAGKYATDQIDDLATQVSYWRRGKLRADENTIVVDKNEGFVTLDDDTAVKDFLTNTDKKEESNG